MSYIAKMIINGVPQWSNWVPSSNTKGYWPLNGDWLDYSGNNHHLKGDSVSGTTAPVLIQGRFGNGYYFTDRGFGSLLWTENNVLTDMSEFTISYWMKSQKPTTPIVGVGGWNEGGIFVGESFRAAAGGLMPAVAWLSNDDKPVIDNTGTYWTNLICTRYAGNTQFYTNSVSGDTVYTQTPNDPSHGWLNFGKYLDQTGDSGGYWKGTLCEVIIEDKAWSQEEVLSYYTQNNI